MIDIRTRGGTAHRCACSGAGRRGGPLGLAACGTSTDTTSAAAASSVAAAQLSAADGGRHGRGRHGRRRHRAWPPTRAAWRRTASRCRSRPPAAAVSAPQGGTPPRAAPARPGGGARAVPADRPIRRPRASTATPGPPPRRPAPTWRRPRPTAPRRRRPGHLIGALRRQGGPARRRRASRPSGVGTSAGAPVARRVHRAAVQLAVVEQVPAQVADARRLAGQPRLPPAVGELRRADGVRQRFAGRSRAAVHPVTRSPHRAAPAPRRRPRPPGRRRPARRPAAPSSTVATAGSADSSPITRWKSASGSTT